MPSRLVVGRIFILSVIVASALEFVSDLASSPLSDDSLIQDTKLLLDPAEQLSHTQPSALLAQGRLPEGSNIYSEDVSGLTTLPLDPTGLSSSDPPGSLFDQPTSLFDVTTLPDGSGSYLSDASDSLFEDDVHTQNDKVDLNSLLDDTLLSDSFEVADCSRSESLPAMGRKSRVRRLDGSGTCVNPSTTPPTAVDEPSGSVSDKPVDLRDLLRLLDSPIFMEMSRQSKKDKDNNQYCFLYTDGNLPWGVCSSGRPDDQRKVIGQLDISGFGSFDAYELDHCTLGTSSHKKEKFQHTANANFQCQCQGQCQLVQSITQSNTNLMMCVC